MADWGINAQYLVGRRFEWRPVTRVIDGREVVMPDVTFVAADPRKRTIRAHAEDGGAQTLNLDDVIEAVNEGVLVESETGVPFVNEPQKGGK